MSIALFPSGVMKSGCAPCFKSSSISLVRASFFKARINGVSDGCSRERLKTALGLAPASKSTLTMPELPRARCKGVRPFSLAKLGCAPLASRAFTASNFPLLAAIIKGEVLPPPLIMEVILSSSSINALILAPRSTEEVTSPGSSLRIAWYKVSSDDSAQPLKPRIIRKKLSKIRFILVQKLPNARSVWPDVTLARNAILLALHHDGEVAVPQLAADCGHRARQFVAHTVDASADFGNEATPDDVERMLACGLDSFAVAEG